MATAVTSFIAVILGGLMIAVQTTREHSEGLQAATSQTQASLDRIRYMVSHAGVYRLDGEPTVAGIAVVFQQSGTSSVPNILVVWSGGRDGGMADAGLQTRLPLISELVIYTTDPRNPEQLLEITVPGNNNSIDFQDSSFDSTIRQIIQSGNVDKTLLCDRIHVVQLPNSIAQIGAVRFDLQRTPSDAELVGVMPQTSTWLELPWAESIASSDRGLRQLTIFMELQLDVANLGFSNSLMKPFWGSASYRYVYHP
ncbi:MAG: hypothetical protein Tsb009_09340 [Planctomycetaceae bacterium]